MGTEFGPEAELLSLLRAFELDDSRQPTFTLDNLAALLCLERASCRQALYDLFRRGLIEVKVYPGGQFELSLTRPRQSWGYTYVLSRWQEKSLSNHGVQSCF